MRYTVDRPNGVRQPNTPTVWATSNHQLTWKRCCKIWAKVESDCYRRTVQQTAPFSWEGLVYSSKAALNHTLNGLNWQVWPAPATNWECLAPREMERHFTSQLLRNVLLASNAVVWWFVLLSEPFSGERFSNVSPTPRPHNPHYFVFCVFFNNNNRMQKGYLSCISKLLMPLKNRWIQTSFTSLFFAQIFAPHQQWLCVPPVGPSPRFENQWCSFHHAPELCFLWMLWVSHVRLNGSSLK